MLTVGQIREKRLIEGAVEASYRGISYDLRVGAVIKPGGDVADFYTVPPQGIVEVISEERVCLPADVTGFAMVKTSLSNQGLLALNIGIIDPGYRGKIGSFFVNFGKREQQLKKGDVFLRVVFHATDGEIGDVIKSTIMDDERYISEKRANMQANFSTEFLDIGAITSKYAKEHFETFRTRVLGYVALAAFILAMMTFLLNFGNLLLVQRFLQPSDATRAELLREALDRNNTEMAERNRELAARIQQLEQRLGSGADQPSRAPSRIQTPEGPNPAGGAPSATPPTTTPSTPRP